MELVTDLSHRIKNNIFEKARIRLTLFYIAIMVVVLGIFSSILVVVLEKNIEESFALRIERDELLNEALIDANQGIETVVLVLDGFLLILIGGASYFLAGVTLKPIKKAMESQKRFSADASHDLRTPLAIITTETEVALNDKNISIDECKKVFESNLEEASRMSLLISDLLMVARTEHLINKDNLVKISIEDPVHKIIERMKSQAEKKNINLKLISDLSGDIRVHLYNFERAIQNILQNSINYTQNGGNIIVRIIEQRLFFTIEITDNGVGIIDKDLPHVFDRFYKASHSRNDGSGSGLGLPIAKQIIEQHGGTITLESKINVGTSVYIKIPKA